MGIAIKYFVGNTERLRSSELPLPHFLILIQLALLSLKKINIIQDKNDIKLRIVCGSFGDE